MTAQPRALAGLVAVLLAIVGVTAVRLPERAAAAESSCPAGIALQNGDFESPVVPAGPGRDVADSDAAAAWHTTATDHQIEYWSDGAGVTAANGNRPISAESGHQWVELNGTQASTLYQDLATVPGQVMRWSLWHRARYTGTPGGQDVMRVLVGSTTAQVQQGADISDGPDAWVNYTGSYVVPPGQTTTRFAFKAVSTSSGNTTVGNFLDDVVFSNAPCLTAEAAVTNLDRASGGLTRPGDHLRYAVSVRNTGGDDASETVVSDTVPAGTTYVPGSLTVDGSAVSDASDGDGGEVSGGQVTGRPGVVGAGGTSAVAFEVTVDPAAAAGTSLSDDPAATYTWAPDPAPYDAVADPVSSTVATTGLTVATSVTGTTDVDADGKLDTGDRVGFAFAVTDTGSVDLGSVDVTARSATGPLSVDCPSGPLAAGTSETCTASYGVVQGDVDRGVATVTATATGTPPSGAADVTSDASTASQPLDRSSSLALSVTGPVTDANGDGVTDLGDVVTWTFRLLNTGTATLSRLAVDDPAVGQISCAATTLWAGDSTTCTATHVVTSADVAAGKVSTTGSASGLDPEGDAVTAEPSGVEVPVTVGSALTLVATSTTADVDGDFRVDLGDQVTWSYRVTNTGSTTLTDVAVDAPTSGPVSCPDSTLAPGASTLCTTAAHVIAQADVDAGSVSSSGTASATGGDGQPVTTDPSSATVPVAQTSALQLSTATAMTDVNQDGRTDPGDAVDWTFLVTNTGTTTLTALAVAASAGAVGCPPGPLAPGATATCTATSHLVTQADVDAGQIADTATATGLAPGGAAVTSNASTSSTPVGAAGALQLTASAAVTDLDGDFRIDLGDQVVWSFVLTNTGSSTLTGLTVTDPVAGAVSCPAPTLAPGAAEACRAVAPYVVSQADVDAGVVGQTGRATGSAPGGSTVTSNQSSTTTPVAQAPALAVGVSPSVADRDGDGTTDLGDGVTWSYLVRNTGTVTLSGISVTSTGTGPVSCPAVPLAPGGRLTCQSDVHVVAPADVAAGAVSTVATAAGRGPDGRTVSSPSASGQTPVLQPAALAVAASGVVTDRDGDGRSDLGDQVGWAVTVTNTGSTTVTGLAVTDSAGGTFTCPVTTLAPQAVTTCAAAASYVITQADVDAGTVTNGVVASGRDPQGASVTSTSGTASVPVDQVSVLQLSATATVADSNGSFTIDLGDQVTWVLKARNTGTTTLSSVTVSSPTAGAVSCPPAPLPPGQGVTCTVPPHAVTQADVDAGVVSAVATASATAPGGGTVTSASATASVPVAQSSALRLTVSAAAADLNHDGRTDLGDTVEWTFLLRNAGTVTLTSPTVADPDADPVSCPALPLAPGASVTCLSAVTHDVTPADVTAGHVDTTATASALTPAGASVPSNTAMGSAPIAQSPNPALTKTAQVSDVNGDYLIDLGDVIRWSFLVQDTGDGPISAIRVVDPLAGPVTCPTTTLAAGRSMTCTAAPYTIGQGDVDAGLVENTATATAMTASGARTASNPSTTDTPIAQRPALALTATATARDVDRDGRIDLGDTISWSFAVQDTGTTTVRDPAVSGLLAGSVPCPVTSLAPGASTSCVDRTPYVITQADVDANHVRSSATATSSDPSGNPVLSPSASTYTPVYQLSAVSLVVAGSVADLDGDGATDLGDTITWSFRVRNTGTTTLYRLVVADPSAGAVSCPAATVPVGASVVCTAATPHTVTAADIGAGSVSTTATARVRDPGGWPLTTPSTSGQVVVAPPSGLRLSTVWLPVKSG